MWERSMCIAICTPPTVTHASGTERECSHENERGFSPMHIYHVACGTPVAAILRAARTPAGTEVRTVVKHVTRRIQTHWPNTRLIWRGDSHYGREEAMQWLENNGGDYIFAFPRNSVLDALVAKTADYLRIAHAFGSKDKLRCYTNVDYQARSWSRPRRVIARLEVSLQPDPNEPGYTRQEVDVRYAVTSLAGDPRRLYEDVYCKRG